MEQYIPKSALVAEIERLRKNQRLDDRHGQGVLDGLHAIENLLNTLEVKEVDLYEDADNYWGTLTSDIRNNIYLNDFYKIAKHFFELGLAVSNKAQKGE